MYTCLCLCLCLCLCVRMYISRYYRKKTTKNRLQGSLDRSDQTAGSRLDQQISRLEISRLDRSNQTAGSRFCYLSTLEISRLEGDQIRQMRRDRARCTSLRLESKGQSRDSAEAAVQIRQQFRQQIREHFRLDIREQIRQQFRLDSILDSSLVSAIRSQIRDRCGQPHQGLIHQQLKPSYTSSLRPRRSTQPPQLMTQPQQLMRLVKMFGQMFKTQTGTDMRQQLQPYLNF